MEVTGSRLEISISNSFIQIEHAWLKIFPFICSINNIALTEPFFCGIATFQLNFVSRVSHKYFIFCLGFILLLESILDLKKTIMFTVQSAAASILP